MVELLAPALVGGTALAYAFVFVWMFSKRVLR